MRYSIQSGKKSFSLFSLITFIFLLIIAPYTSTYAQTQSLPEDISIISDILTHQGETNHLIVNPNFQDFVTLSYGVLGMDNCMLTTTMHVDDQINNTDGSHNHVVDIYHYSYRLLDIADIVVESPPKISIYYAHNTAVAQVRIKLNNSITPVRVQHDSTMTVDAPPAAYPEVSYFMKNLDDANKLANTLHQMSELCGAPKPLAKQSVEDLAGDEQAHYKQVLTHGKPSQMYSMALDMADEGHSELALKMLQAIVDRYPDDPYVAKAIDKKEAIRAAMKKSPESTSGIRHDTGVSSPNLSITNGSTNDNKLQQIQACQASCQSSKNSCDMTYSNNMGTQLGNTINSLRGHNSVAAQNSGSQILGDPNACQDEFDSCTARCH